VNRYSEGWDSPCSAFGLPPLKMEGDVQRFDGEPMSIEEKAAWKDADLKRLRRNYRRRQQYAEKRYAALMGRA
jgi:hypothetical protein